MDKKYEALFTPWKIGNVEIKNRIVLCPMGGTSLFGWIEPYHFDKVAADFFLERAKNNVGLIIPGITPIKNLLFGQWLYKQKGVFKKLKPYMDEIHKTGAKLFVQLTAGFGRSFAVSKPMVMLISNKFLGALVKPILDTSYITAAPSELPLRWKEDVNARALKKKEIEKMIFAFKETAKLCKEAGVDGVEIHAVHEGYLLDQFTTKYTNKRTDEFGGSFENRYRFPVEIVKAIKKECGEDYPVSLRYSVVSKTKDFTYGAMPGEKFVEIGRDMEESEKAIKYLEDAGYDMFNADNGTYDAWYWAHPPAYMPRNCNLEDVAHIKKFTSKPVVCAGKMDAAVASEAISKGEIDGMGVARQFLTDGAWVTKLKEDRIEDIMPCISCHNGCFNLAKSKGTGNVSPLSDSAHMSRCALNPQTMQGHKYDLKPAKKSKKVAIIGGGIGGMECARVLAMRGHKPIIYEKSDHLGGVFVEASNFDFKENDKRLLSWYNREMEKLRVEIHLNEEVKDVKSLKADEIIVATGSKANHLRFSGNEHLISALSYLENKEQVGQKVVIIGGGLTGCEIAYDLHTHGHEVVIVEALNDLIISTSISLANTSYLRDYFRTNNVEVHLEATALSCGKDHVLIKEKDGKEVKIECDSIIESIGYKPTPLAKKSGKVHVVGDALKVGNLRTVIWGAWDVAIKI